MVLLALKMLIADRAKFIGILIGVTFATFIITQQAGILTGIMTRTFGFVTDTSQADIWVTDPRVNYIEDIKTMRSPALFRVRGVEGVSWAVPLHRGTVRAKFRDGNYQNCVLVGIDDATLIGGPPVMIEGDIVDLRRPDAVFVNDVGAQTKLALAQPGTENKIPLPLGYVFELGDKRAQVAGFFKVERTFRSEPVIYTTYSRALSYAPRDRNKLSFILVKAKPGVNINDLTKRIKKQTNLAAYTNREFKKMTVLYYIKNTGIVINFGFAVILGFIIGLVISGQTFYNFALDNLRYFAIYKAMGAKNHLLTKMIGIQALFTGFLGYGFGIGLTTLFSLVTRGTELSFKFPWELFLGSFLSILLIVIFSAFLCIRKILKVDPFLVFE